MSKFLKGGAIAAVLLSSSLALAQAPEPTPSPNGTAKTQPAAKKKPPVRRATKKKPARKKTAKKPATTNPK